MLSLYTEFGTVQLGYNMETFLLGFGFLAIMVLAVWGLFVKTPRERYEEQVSIEELESPSKLDF